MTATTRVVVLGADAVLAALPATAVQLVHACLEAGYQSAVPGSWGDELVAEAYLDALATRPPGPAVCGHCPLVRERLRTTGADLSRFLVPLASPPIAAARYLRRLAGATPLHVTYVGDCPGAEDPVVDARLSPRDFLAALAERGIVPCEQPTVFESVLPPDRRRHLSLPGGVPAPDALWAGGGGRRLVEITADDYSTELAEHLLDGEPLLLDIAPRLGCPCSGVTAGVAPRNARLVVSSLEPPRATTPVLPSMGGGLADPPAPRAPGASPQRPPAAPPLPDVVEQEPPPRPRAGSPHLGVPRAAMPDAVVTHRRSPARPSGSVPRVSGAVPIPASNPTPAPRASGGVRVPSLTPAGGVYRRTPVGLSRLTTGAPPMARRADGRLLPRAYVARGHSQPRLQPVPEVPASPFESGGVAVATPPTTPTTSADVGGEVETFVAGLAVFVTRHVEAWRTQLDDAIGFWNALGFRTDVLERARTLDARPDVDGLLATFAAAAEHLRLLEAAAACLHPGLRGHALFRDPERVPDAEALVARLERQKQ
jgi:hypothetical protein